MNYKVMDDLYISTTSDYDSIIYYHNCYNYFYDRHIIYLK